MTRPEIFAHRGAKAVAPENTLPAFAAALEMNVDGVELDVQCAADGQLVVIHDFVLERTTNGHGAVAEHSAAELARLDAGSHFSPAYAAVGIPTLAEVLDLIGDRCRVNVEIKSHAADGGAEVEPLVEMIRARRLCDQVIVSSFNPITLIKLRCIDPDVALGLLYDKEVPPCLWAAWMSPIISPQAVHPVHRLVTADVVDRAHGAHRAVNTWTVNDPDDAFRLADLGVDVLISDVPDVLMAAFDAEKLMTGTFSYTSS